MKTDALPNISVKQNKWTIVAAACQAYSHPGRDISPKVNIYTEKIKTYIRCIQTPYEQVDVK